ncbi:glycosyltransferase [Rhodoferax sp.]|uniref:glycosyltransferase n=1 Tax=Rhodoferax sp. TaxID=50421 RepID=UPI0026219840|nr:glycosyltransferase [Rhodoferax sp.]MDD2808224.1 glycosyltransferase [Rhodoferax sp.]MDD4941983.1 glycosyltransferase [Rhodoferax sp.]MDD5480351.1 glycosyltransferase [Rhodoferax sp.]
MRVLHVIPSVAAAHGGPSKAIVAIEQVLAQHGVAITTATTDDDGPGRRQPANKQPMAGAGASRVYFPKRLEFYKVAPAMLPWLWRNVRNFDVVHIHALFSFSCIAAALVARLQHVPYVIRPLGTLTRYGVTQRRPWLKQISLVLFEGPALRHASAVHFTSDDEQREAAQCGIAMKGVVIPLGIEAPASATDALVRAQFPALQGAPYLLYLSRLDPKKNVEGLLQAFAQCRAQMPGVKLFIAGNGATEYVATLAQFASTAGLNDHIVWAGHIEGDLKASALAGALLFVLPSFSENFGIAAAEALMAGLPCVLGKGVAISQDVVEAGAGVAVSPDPASIAAGLVQLLAATAGRANMAKNAIVLAHSKFSAQAMGVNLMKLYSEILKK